MDNGSCARLLAGICHSFSACYMWHHALYILLVVSAFASVMVLSDSRRCNMWSTAYCGIGFATLLNSP
eukprot:2832067-Prorocentrum_lima.AAC.1